MRCFTVTEEHIYPYISIVTSPYPHIGIGEEGRGRTYVRFPVAQRFAETLGESPRVERASVLKTKEKGTLLLIEEKDAEDKRILLLVDIGAGFRGYTKWSGVKGTEVPCPYRGNKSYYLATKCPECGALYETSENDDALRIHAETGTVFQYEDFPPAGITVLAEGYCAQGAAGRMGGHAVRLLIMEPGSAFRVVRYGRLYGAPAERFVFWDGENLRLGTRDEVWPPTQEVVEGELI